MGNFSDFVGSPLALWVLDFRSRESKAPHGCVVRGGTDSEGDGGGPVQPVNEWSRSSYCLIPQMQQGSLAVDESTELLMADRNYGFIVEPVRRGPHHELPSALFGQQQFTDPGHFQQFPVEEGQQLRVALPLDLLGSGVVD